MNDMLDPIYLAPDISEELWAEVVDDETAQSDDGPDDEIYIPETRRLATAAELGAFWEEFRETPFGQFVSRIVRKADPRTPDERRKALEQTHENMSRGMTI